MSTTAKAVKVRVPGAGNWERVTICDRPFPVTHNQNFTEIRPSRQLPASVRSHNSITRRVNEIYL